MLMSMPISSVAADPDKTRAGYLTALGLLAGAFAFRVSAQAIQIVAPTDLLPAAAAWQGSGLPYPVLLASQIVILAAMGWSLFRVARGRPVFPARRAPLAIGLGVVYFAVMAFRLVAGLTFLADHHWFAAPLPATFHLVLASFLMLLGVRDRSPAARPGALFREGARRLAYPVTMAFGFALYFGLAAFGLEARHAAFVAAAVAIAAILLQEQAMPYRPSWRPGGREVAADSLFLVLVQILLPNALALLAATALAGAPRLAVAAHGLWPHQWPVAAQVVLMILGADFLRYWLHRAMHTHPLLWHLHKVHHAPERLYALNVGRFHPADKAIQFLFDSLPFILLGVGADVVALYFVFYAINGFYQHSNCDVRLGLLNHVISGPELHRWHHSCLARESNTNYGNNVIVWDILFGSRFLPSDRQVGMLGVEPVGAAQIARDAR